MGRKRRDTGGWGKRSCKNSNICVKVSDFYSRDKPCGVAYRVAHEHVPSCIRIGCGGCCGWWVLPATTLVFRQSRIAHVGMSPPSWFIRKEGGMSNFIANSVLVFDSLVWNPIAVFVFVSSCNRRTLSRKWRHEQIKKGNGHVHSFMISLSLSRLVEGYVQFLKKRNTLLNSTIL